MPEASGYGLTPIFGWSHMATVFLGCQYRLHDREKTSEEYQARIRRFKITITDEPPLIVRSLGVE